MNLFLVHEWNKHFENNRTRELVYLDWVPIPNKMDGDGYTQLMDHQDGMEHFGAWVLIVEVASKCDPRGILLRGGNIPHDHRSLARVTRGSLRVFEAAIPRLLEIGWLMAVDVADGEALNELLEKHRHNPAPKCGAYEERNGTERNGKLFPAAELELAEEIYQCYPLKVGKPAALKAIAKAIKSNPSDYLRERTAEYAKAVVGTDTFLPHPSTWFNEERYNDDPSTWVRKNTNQPTNRKKGPNI